MPVTKDKSQISCIVPKNLWNKIKKIAFQEEKTATKILIQFLEDGVENFMPEIPIEMGKLTNLKELTMEIQQMLKKYE